MKKSLMAAALILFTSQFALAEEVFYIILDHETKECRVVNGTELASTLMERDKQLGQYGTMGEAKAALDSMGCPQFYIILDITAKECRVVKGTELASTQPGRFKHLGKYATKDEAKAALDLMGCPQ